MASLIKNGTPSTTPTRKVVRQVVKNSRTAGTITSMMIARIMRTPSYQPVLGPSSLIPKPRDRAADTMRRKMVCLLLDFMTNSKKFLAAGTGVS
ncbi:hypothetical protein NC651_034718 [Populus alba x Populus x berolinensis]|nr:hypothetical protein NC651_034718 [Populus alba x Populus x berolinensis]